MRQLHIRNTPRTTSEQFVDISRPESGERKICSMSIGFASAIASVVGQTTVAGVFGGLTTSAAPATITIDVGKADHVFKVGLHS